MDFVTAQARVADYLDWASTAATTKIKNWINDTRLDIAARYNFDYLFTESTQVTTTENTYAWPSDMLDHMTIFLDDAQGNPIVLYEMTKGYYASRFKIPNASAPDTAPFHIIRKGTEFQIYPDPVAGRTLTLWYYAQPATLILDADYDYMMNIYGEVVVFGAAYRGVLYLDDDVKIAKYIQEFNAGVQKMVMRESGKRLPKQIRFRTWQEFDVDNFNKFVKHM